MRRVALIAVALAMAACGGGGGSGDSAHSTSAAPRARQQSPPAGPPPRLTVSHPCDDAKGFTCSTLLVGLDHSGRTPGDLRLAVAAADNADAPKGVLVALTGGPGQGGGDFVARSRGRMRALLHDYRLVMFDQRGTRAGALRCPALQRAVGTSDLTVPPRGSVEACARRLGERRRFYSTADTVADLEALRVALGADKLTLDGTSYGTFVAERYAIAHPDRVARLVLDSVVPAARLDAPSCARFVAGRSALAPPAGGGRLVPAWVVPPAALDPLGVGGRPEPPRVLRAVSPPPPCRGAPADALAAVVRARHDGPEIDD